MFLTNAVTVYITCDTVFLFVSSMSSPLKLTQPSVFGSFLDLHHTTSNIIFFVTTDLTCVSRVSWTPKITLLYSVKEFYNPDS